MKNSGFLIWGILLIISALAAAAQRPIAFYRFEDRDDLGFDESGYGRHGSVTGVKQLQGRIGQAAYFDGASRILVEGFRGHEWGTTLSISLWFKIVVQGREYAGLINSGWYEKGAWELRLSPERHGGHLFGGVVSVLGRTLPDVKTSGLEVGPWYHCVMTYDGSQVRLYLDGRMQLSEGSDGGPIIASDNALSMGHGGLESPREEFFNGLIDEVMIFDRVLTSDEISRLGKGELLSFAKPSSTAVPKEMPPVALDDSRAVEMSTSPENATSTAPVEPTPAELRAVPARVVPASAGDDKVDNCCQTLNAMIVDWKAGNRERAIRELDRLSRNYQP